MGPSYAALRDEFRRQGRALEESVLRTPPSDYPALMRIVGKREGLQMAEDLMTKAMRPDNDDDATD